MKYFKYALYSLAAVAVLTGAVLAYIAATFDPNAYKDALISSVAEKTGRTLTLEGDIRLTLFPKIGLGLGKTALSDAQATSEFAAVNDVRVALAVIPLLSRRVVVDEILIDGLRARLVRHSDGRLSIDDLLAPRDAGAAAEAPGASDPVAPSVEPDRPVELDIQGIRVTDAALTWIDEQAGTRHELSEVLLKTGRVTRGVATDFEFAAALKSTQPALDLQIRATGRWQADPGAQQYTVDALRVHTGGSAAGLREIDATLTADIRAQAARNQIDALSIDVSAALDAERFTAGIKAATIVFDQGALNVEQLVGTLAGRIAGVALSSARISVPRLNVDLDRQLLRLEGASLNAAGEQAANRFDIVLDAPRLDITPDAASGQDIVATLKATGPQLAASAGVRVSGMAGSGQALRIAQLALDLDARQADSTVKGRLSTPLSADLKARRFDLSALAGKFDVRSPALPTKAVSLTIKGKADVDAQREQVNADLDLRFDESNIKASFGTKGFASPFHSFDIAIDQLNVDRYRPPASKQDGAAGDAGTGAGKETETPFNLSPLKQLHLDGKIRVGHLTVSRIKAENVRFDVKAKDGKLEINPLSANLYQGAIKGTIAVDAVSNGFSAKQQLTGVAIGPLLRDAIERDLLDGRGTIGLDLSASGNTVSALKQSLGGAADMNLRDGAIKGINLGQSLRGAKNMLSGGSSETAAASTQQTDFSELSASFAIRNGKARNEDLTMKSPFVRLSGAGDIDIAGGALDYVAKTSLVATSAGQGGKETGELSGLTVPLRVSGPFDALKFKLNFGAALDDGNRQKLEQKKEALKQKLESQITDKLLGGKATPAPAEGEAKPPDDASKAAPASSPEQEIKKRLKNLLQ